MLILDLNNCLLSEDDDEDDDEKEEWFFPDGLQTHSGLSGISKPVINASAAAGSWRGEPKSGRGDVEKSGRARRP